MALTKKNILVLMAIVGVMLAIPSISTLSTGSPPTIPTAVFGIILQEDGSSAPAGTVIEFKDILGNNLDFQDADFINRGDGNKIIIDNQDGWYDVIVFGKSGIKVTMFVNGEDTGRSFIYGIGAVHNFNWGKNMATVEGNFMDESGNTLEGEVGVGIKREVITPGILIPGATHVQVASTRSTGTYRIEFVPTGEVEIGGFPRDAIERKELTQISQDLVLSPGLNRIDLVFRYNQQVDDTSWQIRFINPNSGSGVVDKNGPSDILLTYQCSIGGEIIKKVEQTSTFFDCGNRNEGETLKVEVFHRFKGDLILDHTLERVLIIQEDPPICMENDKLCDGNELLLCEGNKFVNKGLVPGQCNAPFCGDNSCNNNENVFSCAVDCGYCGNLVCDPGETIQFCPQDCDPNYDLSDVEDPGPPVDEPVELEPAPEEIIIIGDGEIIVIPGSDSYLDNEILPGFKIFHLLIGTLGLLAIGLFVVKK